MWRQKLLPEMHWELLNSSNFAENMRDYWISKTQNAISLYSLPKLKKNASSNVASTEMITNLILV